MATAALAMQEAADYLNDFGLTFFLKEQLFRLIMTVHRELQVKLFLNGIPVIKKKSTAITVAIGATNLGASQPTDLIEPISLWERLSGSTDDFAMVTEKGWEPEIQAGDSLLYWTWRGEKLLFVGALTTREVKIYYKAGISVPTQDSDSLGFLFAENYIAPRAAAKMAFILGNSNAATVLNNMATENLDDVIRMNVIGQQALPVRRRPYHGRRSRTS